MIYSLTSPIKKNMFPIHFQWCDFSTLLNYENRNKIFNQEYRNDCVSATTSHITPRFALMSFAVMMRIVAFIYVSSKILQGQINIYKVRRM